MTTIRLPEPTRHKAFDRKRNNDLDTSRAVRIVTWNVNSVRQRLEHLLRYLQAREPDVVCLQEIKCTETTFPRIEIEAAGYSCALVGQKGFNGVALLSKRPLEDVRLGLPGGVPDEPARYIEATMQDGPGIVRIASIYFPNGNPAGTEKYTAKLDFMDRLLRHARDLLENEEPLVLAGDYNVIPQRCDVHEPDLWVEDALFLPATRARFQALLHLGFIDAVRATSDEAALYTFWDYQAGAWQKNKGIRIDHVLLSPEAADRLRTVDIDKYTRAEDKPSDHVPVRIELSV